MKIILVLLSMFFTACTVATPHVSEYTLEPLVKHEEYIAKSCKEKSLKVGKVFSSNTLMSHKMNYIASEYEVSAFTQSKWSRTPNRAISDELVKSIRSSEIFTNISTYKSRAKSDLLLEAHVEKFIQYFDTVNDKSYVEVHLTLNLLSTKDSTSMAHATFSTKVDTGSVNARGGVVALNIALSKILLETNIWLNGVCK